MNRVCVIGAGPSGMSALIAFKDAKNKGAEIPEVVCYEKSEKVGGQWNQTWRVGLNEHGEPVHSSMYKFLWSNGPKECLEFPDYTFDEHFGQPTGSYPPREVLESYLHGHFKKYDCENWIKFSHVIRHVTFSEETNLFTVTALNLLTNNSTVEEFEHVIVCTGHFSTPYVPKIENIENFDGRVLHGHDFKNANEFKDKNVLVVGGSYSAEDIGLQCYKYGAKSVTSCYRTKPIGFKWPPGYVEKSNIVRTEGKTCYFKDGTTNEIDAIILCTGYLHSFPFLEDKLRLKKARNILWIDELYKNLFLRTNMKLSFIGMMDQFYTFNMFDLQAWYIRDVILGRIKLTTDMDVVAAENKVWNDKCMACKDAHDQIVFQADQCKDLTDHTDYPKMDYEAINQLFFDWEDLKDKDITSYRDGVHKSFVTGTMSGKHQIPWLESMDDSMAAYLRNCK